MSNIPKLRFPEFSVDWKEKKLSDFSFRSAKKNRDNNINLVFTNSAVNGIVNQQDYFDKDIANQNNLDGYYIVNKDDFIYNPRISNFAPVGPLNRNHLDIVGIISPLYTVFKIDEKMINLDFVERYFKTTKWHKYMNNVANYGVRSDRMNITNNDFFAMPIPIPSLSEQEKIASFLSAVDTKIEQLIQKESLLQSYKKGVMQKLFSQEIRFKADDGSEFPEWEEKKLGDLFVSKKGKGLSKNDILENSQNKCILYGELYTTYKEVINEIRSFTNANDGIKSISGDLLIPCSTTTTGIDLANATALYEDNVLLGGDISILRFKKQGNSTFYAYYLTHFKKYDLAKYGQGSTIVHMYFEHFKLMDIFIPSSLQEQTKIANLLSSIDKKIELISKEIEKAKEFKKGLLQQIFV